MQTNVLNKKIKNAYLTEFELFLVFENDKKIMLFDNADVCCEYRYVTSLHDMKKLIGQEIKNIEFLKPTENNNHEIQECKLITSVGNVNVMFHNEHNGSHGGFSLIFLEVNE